MHPSVNILHLRFFSDAVLYKSISESAKMNFVTQSAVSQGIRNLEKALGVQLLMHSRQKFQLTEEGKIVFEQSRQVFQSIQNIYKEINRDKEVITGSLKFVTTKSLGMSLVAPSYKKIKKLFPQVDIDLRLGGLNYIRNSLKQEDVEFGIVVYDENFTQFAKHTFKRGLFNLYQGVNAQNNDFEEHGILVNYFEGTFVNELRKHLKKHSKLKIKNALSGWDILARFADLNIGIGFFPDYIVGNNRYPNIKTYPLQLPLFDYEISIIYNKGKNLSRAACAFIEQLPELIL